LDVAPLADFALFVSGALLPVAWTTPVASVSAMMQAPKIDLVKIRAFMSISTQNERSLASPVLARCTEYLRQELRSRIVAEYTIT
jgi:hypothetical protein